MTDFRIAGVVDDSVVDGPGVRYVVFAQGCPHHCPGCHNPDTHSFSAGKLVSVDALLEDLTQHKYIKGVTLSGGEPLAQPEAAAEFARKLKALGYHVIIFTGFYYDEILADPKRLEVIKWADVLVEGRFDCSKKSLALKFRGSTNQRIIDVQESLKIREAKKAKAAETEGAGHLGADLHFAAAVGSDIGGLAHEEEGESPVAANDTDAALKALKGKDLAEKKAASSDEDIVLLHWD